MAVLIADVQEEGVGNAVAARPAFDVCKVAGRGHQIEKVDDVQRRRDPEGGVV